MKIKTNEAIKDLKGIAIKKDGKDNFTVGDALANILVSDKVGGKMKMFILAQKCANDKEIDVDKADISMIRDAVDRTEQYNNLVNGQLLVMLDDLKEK